jgi:hypothetical protein
MAPDPQTARLAKFPDLKAKTRNTLLGGEAGTQFDLGERLFAAYADGDVLDYGEFTARDYTTMLSRDGQAQAIESVLTLPLRQANYAITPAKHDQGEAEFVRSVLMAPATAGGMKTPFGVVIGQMTSAQIYKKAFFEKVWERRESDGKIVYAKLAYRPPATCELKRDAQTADEDGFRQQVWLYGGELRTRNQKIPGWVDIPKIRSYVYIHGKHRAPLTGTSEMEICLWCYRTKLKLIFLWLQYLEQQSLPKMLIYGQNQRQATAMADDIASMRASGIAAFERPPQGAKTFELLESSGKGADQFNEALSFLETWQTSSVLAGFIGLSSLASLGRGSLALSQDQSSFYLKSRQAVSAEMCESFTHHVIAPLVTLNFGPDAAYPRLTSGPLTDDSEASLVTLFQELAVAPSLRIPDGILDLITERLASVLNLDQDLVTQIIQQGAKDRATQAVAAAPPGMPKTAAAGIGQLAGATAAATKLARAAVKASGKQPLPEDLNAPYTPPPQSGTGPPK